MSLRLHLLNGLLRVFEKPKLARAKSPDELRKPFETKARLFFPSPRKTKYKDDELRVGEKMVPAHWAITKNASKDLVILYFHGGGYVFGSPSTHRAMLARLSAMTGMAACLPDYRLAPEHPFPAAINDAVTAYRALLERGIPADRIIMGGDSAGGGLVLALLGEITRQSLPQPVGVFALSPLTDLTFSGESFGQNKQSDVMLPAERAVDMTQMYLQDHAADDPRASPIKAQFFKGTPVYLIASDSEILLDDTRRMTRHLRSQGVSVTEKIVHNHPHVWPIFQRFLPEADQGLRDIAAWIKPLLSR
ncbi:alpha/beta hydrolase [Profundibacter sp.]